MSRDSRFGERIIWTGRPEVPSTPPFVRASAAVLCASALISVCFAVVVARSLGASPAPMLLFGAWAATLAVGLVHGPRIWLARVSYLVTDNHVIFKRGPFRRTIERRDISFARIHWQSSGVGDVELVRAVPTGALRRRLMLRLYGLKAPDRVAAIISGTEDIALAHGDHASLAQRLQVGERVLWAANPKPSWRAYLPQHRREISSLLFSILLTAVGLRMAYQSVPTLQRVAAAGLPAGSLAFEALAAGVGMAVLTVLAMAVVLFYLSIIRPGRLSRATRYMVTNRRVLIQRGREELHLDRTRIVDVIDAPAGDGLFDVFLVLDGPRARALAASGAFGEEGDGEGLVPVLQRLDDVEGLSRALSEPEAPLPRAA
jgi:hypothetical protein